MSKSASSPRKTKRNRSLSSEESPKYERYELPSFSPTIPKTKIARGEEYKFSIFVPPHNYLMRVKSKSYPKTNLPYQILRNTRKQFTANISFEHAIAQVTEHVRSNKCKELRRQNAIESANESNLGIIAKTREDEMVGFATIYFSIKDRDEKSAIESVFVDILCGHPNYSGVGTAMLDYIKTHVCEPLDIKKIDLDSITESLGFYVKKGFQCNPCKMRYTLKKRAK